MLAVLTLNSPKQQNSSCRCSTCKVNLGVLHWKHHCRLCQLTFCNSCCSFKTKLSDPDFYSENPRRVINTKPQKCCFDCNNRLRFQEVTDEPDSFSQPRVILGIIGSIVNEELSSPVKHNTHLYAVKVPSDGTIRAGQTIRARLGGNTYLIVVPPHIRPRGVFYVRTTDGTIDTCDIEDTNSDHSGATILVDASDLVNSNKSSGKLSPHHHKSPAGSCDLREARRPSLPTVSVTCRRCSYKNKAQVYKCAMCESDLPSFC